MKEKYTYYDLISSTKYMIKDSYDHWGVAKLPINKVLFLNIVSRTVGWDRGYELYRSIGKRHDKN